MSQARYDAVADFYARSFDSADDPVSLALLGLLGRPIGLHILDVACGHGRITRELARRGADVVGIDISGRLITMAQEAEQNEPLGTRYIHADVTAPDVLDRGVFDAVTCSFGLSDIEDLDRGIAAVSHAGRYHDEGRWTARGALSTLRRQVGANHRMLSTYLNTLRAHDLWLDQITEPVPAPDWDQAHDADRKPVYLVARSPKMSSR